MNLPLPWRTIAWFIPVFLFFQFISHPALADVRETGAAVIVSTENYNISIIKDGFRFEFQRPDGEVIAPAHPDSGIQIGLDPSSLEDVAETVFDGQAGDVLRFAVRTSDGTRAAVEVELQPHWARLSIDPAGEGDYAILGRTAGISSAFGLADHGAILPEQSVLRPPRDSPELTGFRSDALTTSQPRRPYGRGIRIASNFVVFPRQGFATVNVEPMEKIVRVTEEESAQGVARASSLPSLYYFVGSPERIYRSLKEVRSIEGYPFMMPKYEFFGVGWEAWGALAWDTNQETVRENVQKYLDLGFPLSWMVIGSGFWPREKGPEYIATTSFGDWDEKLYPDPVRLTSHFRDQGLKVLLGLRITFTAEGPHSREGVEKGFFMRNGDGSPRIFKTNFPGGDVYLLDTKSPEAVEWYAGLCGKWMAYGIDGFKEDFMDRPEGLGDDAIDPVNEALMKKGAYIMGRNMYLGSPADIHRYDDFNFNQSQDRGPINGLSLAYSGFPYVYPDVVGGTQKYFKDASPELAGVYLMRFAEYAALNPAMGMGYGPWNLEDPRVVEVVREAARLHHRLRPYTYSYAIRAFHTGFPWPLTPLPLACPDDPEVYRLDNRDRRSFQWLIGESLLAAPLYGDDYATAASRDVYLPEGTWVEYDSGEIHEGPTTLRDYPLPIGKTPLFVGGTGIVVEEIGEELKARIYPVAREGELVFYGQDGEVRNRITLAGPNWDDPVVIDESTGEKVSVKRSRHAHEFLLLARHDYRIE